MCLVHCWGLNGPEAEDTQRSFLQPTHKQTFTLRHLFQINLHSFHSRPQRPIRTSVATNLTTAAALTHDGTVTTGDDRDVVIDIEDVDGDGDLTNHPRVICKTVHDE